MSFDLLSWKSPKLLSRRISSFICWLAIFRVQGILHGAWTFLEGAYKRCQVDCCASQGGKMSSRQLNLNAEKTVYQISAQRLVESNLQKLIDEVFVWWHFQTWNS